MTEETIQHDDEISLLDILVTLAESWKLLVFGPLVVGVLAGGLSFFLPKTFESVTIVRLSEVQMGLLNSPAVLDPVIEKIGLLSEFDGIQEDARLYLSKKLMGKFDKKTNLATITAAATTPERARELGLATMDALLNEMMPKGKYKENIEQEILVNQRVIDINYDAIEQMQKNYRNAGKKNAELESIVNYLVMLTKDTTEREIKIIDIKKELTVDRDYLYIQQPSLPKHNVSPKLRLVVLLAILASGFALLIFVFVRKAWCEAAKDPEAGLKIRLINKLLFAGRTT